MTILSSQFLQIYSSRRAAIRYAGFGDSYTAGANSAGIYFSMIANGKVIIMFAAPGAAIDAVKDQMVNNAAIANRYCKKALIWDGSQNGYTSIAQYGGLMATGIAALAIDFVIIPAAAPFGLADQTQVLAIRDDFVSRWGAKVYDWRNNVPNTGGIINADQMQVDQVHLIQSAQDLCYVGYSPKL